MAKFVYFAFVLILGAALTYAQDDDPDMLGSPDATKTEIHGMGSWDDLMNDATMETLIDSVAMIAKDPGDIAAFALNDDPIGGVKVEGDMLFTPEQLANLHRLEDDENENSTKTRKKRKAIKHGRYRWSSKNVPYEIYRGHFSSRDQGVIRRALGEWQRRTCLTFSRGTSGNRLRFQNGGGCSSYVGVINRGPQPVTLARGCRVHGIVVHEVGHAIGFQHEQTRPDRDRYVTIHRANIQPRTLFNFQRYGWDSVVAHGVPYDYLSIMHYGSYAFSRNGRQTISVKDARYRGKIGNRGGLSFRDIKLANAIYNCAAACTGSNRKKCPGEGFLDKNCKCQCPGRPIKECRSTGTVKPGPKTTKRPTRKPVTVKPPPTGCADISSHCKSWAIGKGCKVHYPTMSKICRYTCKLCKRVTCTDKNKNCKRWKKYCEAAKYKNYMKKHCPRTCNKCASGNQSTGDVDCVDKSADCEDRSKNGECESDVGKMRKECSYTCSYC